jgi:hypothetical protein
MNRRQWMVLPWAATALLRRGAAQQQATQEQLPAGVPVEEPENILLKDYYPKSIYRIPQTVIPKAKYPAIDVHCHGFRPPQGVDEAVKVMDAAGIEKSVIFTGASTLERFNEVKALYSKYPSRFYLWCSFDLTGADQPDFPANAVKALEDCHRAGAAGVGELSDKGRGLGGRGGGRGGRGGRAAGGRAPGGDPNGPAPSNVETIGPHPDDGRMDPLWQKCSQLGMPVNIHVSDPIWSYQKLDNTNDGLMNGYTWRIDVKPNMYGHNELIESLERAVKKHPKTIFIACHFMNLDYDLTRLGQIFDRNPNLYADVSARFAETATIPRYVNQFIQKYQRRICYGTDMPYTARMFGTTFRILESNDEHFYERDQYFNYNYHWPLHGFGLPAAALKDVYHDNAMRAFQEARKNAA